METVATEPQVRQHSLTDINHQAAVTQLLRMMGEDPMREGLRDTPARVVRAWKEMTAGYGQDPAAILGTTFPGEGGGPVVVTGIEFASLCEHHVLPFEGVAHVAYLPGDRIVGLSKIPRLVHCFARRLQVQERLTDQVAKSLFAHVGAKAVLVQVKARHSCMGLRGVRCGGNMTTSSFVGKRLYQHELTQLLALATR